MPEPEVDWMLAPLPSGRHGIAREDVVRSQRLRLLRGAIVVAGTEGYGAMTVSAVIARAGVSRKTFYEQFADREHCFIAAYELIARRALDGMAAAFARNAPWPERLRAALAWTLQELATHPCEARVAFGEVLAAGPRALARRDRALEEVHALLRPGVACAPAGVAIPASAPAAAVGGLFELIGLHVRRGDVAELPVRLPELLFCALAPFTGPAAAAELCVGVADAAPAAAGA